MRRWKLIGVVIVIVVVAIVGVALEIIGSRGSVVSTTAISDTACTDPCLRFPTVSGDNLPGQSFNLPADFQGQSILVLVPFDENQQVQAQTWLPIARELAQAHPDFSSYNVPVFPSMAAPMRAIVRGGMTFSISDSTLRAQTITVFLDNRDQFLAALKLTDVETMPVFLLNDAGDIRWQGAGVYSEAQGDALRKLLAA